MGALVCAGAMAPAAPAWAETQIRLESYVDVFAGRMPHPAREDGALSWSRISLSTDLSLAQHVAFSFAGYAAFTSPHSLNGAPSAPDAHSVSARYADITAFNLRLDWRNFDIVLGKYGVHLGVADLCSPLAALEPVNLNDPLHAFPMGLWQAGADFYTARSSFSLRIIPFDERSRLPAPRSRWQGDSGDIALINIGPLPAVIPTLRSLTITDRFRSDAPSHWGYLASYKHSGEGFDVSAGAYYGPGLYPVVQVKVRPGPDVTVYKERAQSLIGFATFTLARSEWKTYGELLVEHATDGGDDDFLQGVVGLSYDAWRVADALDLDSTSLTLEYTGDLTLHRMKADPLRFSSKVSRPYRNSALASLDCAITSDLSLYAKAAVNADTTDSALWTGARYRYTDDLSFYAQIDIFNGAPNTPFGRWRYNDGGFVGFDYVL